ncbi:MAG: hypothetical protein Q9227_009526 [Pyrenula ochraceoflavens]
MSSKPKSKWAHEEDSADVKAQRKREKEEKKLAKAAKARELEAQSSQQSLSGPNDNINGTDRDDLRPAKRRKTSPDNATHNPVVEEPKLLSFPTQRLSSCRDVEDFDRLNDIEEGSYGWVARAKEKATGEVVALKKLKMDYANDGFPVTGLREIQTLMACQHANIVRLREIVMGSTLKDVYLVMDFLEHDLKTLLEDMQEPFLPSEIKTLMQQIVSATAYLHSQWILHRDLKTSNLLMNNRGEIKLADFGMARYTGNPPPNLTQLVVTLWYRSPELLLGAERYGPEIDVWSIGCIFGELLTKDPLFQGKNEVDQLSKIFALMGNPSRQTWPNFSSLPNAKAIRPLLNSPNNNNNNNNAHGPSPSKFPYLTQSGFRLLTSMLSLNPDDRPQTAEISQHPYFKEDPKPKAKEMFPTFPSKAGQEKRRRRATPQAPVRGQAPKMGEEDFAGLFAARGEEEKGAGFALRLG